LREHDATLLERFLRAVDEELEAPQDIIIIGGAALSIAYRNSYATRDIDLWSSPEPVFWEACRRARARLHLDIPVSPAGVAQAPHDFESRLLPVEHLGLKRLKIWVPERHDLAMMKTVRGAANDLEAIREMHEEAPLALETLLSRFHETDVMGSRGMFRLAFLEVVALLFGEPVAKQVADSL
jgi:hypothetical protein